MTRHSIFLKYLLHFNLVSRKNIKCSTSKHLFVWFFKFKIILLLMNLHQNNDYILFAVFCFLDFDIHSMLDTLQITAHMSISKIAALTKKLNCLFHEDPMSNFFTFCFLGDLSLSAEWTSISHQIVVIGDCEDLIDCRRA